MLYDNFLSNSSSVIFPSALSHSLSVFLNPSLSLFISLQYVSVKENILSLSLSTLSFV